MHQVKENVKNSVQTKKDLHSGPKCAAKFGKVIKFAAAAKSLRTTVVCNGFFGNVCDVIRGALGGAQAHRRQCVPNPRLHEARSKPYLLMFQINLVSN